jgi:glutathione S-transferase
LTGAPTARFHSTMLTLYASPHSANSRKVYWALEEVGANFEYRTVDLRKGEQKDPAYLKLNPNGRVPTLDDGGFVLWESNALLWYVADKYGQGHLVPNDFGERALIDQWMWWQASDLSRAVSQPWLMRYLQRAGSPVDESEHAHFCEVAKRPLAVLDAHLQGKRFVVAERFSIADIALCETAAIAEEAGISLAPFPGVRHWLAGLADRPAFQKTRPR